jgi:hypothetical protein
MKTFWRRFWSDDRGQDLIEYTLMLAFVALASAALFSSARRQRKCHLVHDGFAVEHRGRLLSERYTCAAGLIRPTILPSRTVDDSNPPILQLSPAPADIEA